MLSVMEVDVLGTMSACWLTRIASFRSAAATDCIRGQHELHDKFTSSALKQTQTSQ